MENTSTLHNSIPVTNQTDRPKIKVALVSCGLGNVNRGFEVSTARWNSALKNESRLDVKLFAGGKYDNATVINNFTRDSLTNGPLAFLPILNDRKRWELAYGIEQISVAIGLIPHLFRWKPDVIWTKEAPFAHLLDAFRMLFNFKYKILFANGGAFKPSTYKQFDFIQHLQLDSYQEALAAGIPAEKMLTLCNCVPYTPVKETRQELRHHFGYTDDDWIIISVAAWNRYHKRIDYLIDEVANLDVPNMKLLLVGHPDTETPGLKKLAAEKLGNRVKWLTLSSPEVRKAANMSDIFVLPSLHECLGGSLIDGAMAPIPLVTHPHPGAKFILQDNYWMTDLEKPGNLAKRLIELKNNPPSVQKLELLKKSVIDRFDEATLSKQFTEMIHKIASGTSLN